MILMSCLPYWPVSVGIGGRRIGQKSSRTESYSQLLASFSLILLGNIGNFHHMTLACSDIIIATQALSAWIEVIWTMGSLR